ncbi:hypothetical protein MKW98_003521, partial [Papaver atlanticum]
FGCYKNASDILISQQPTGDTYKGKPEYELTFFNSCGCTQDNKHPVQRGPLLSWVQ